ncbi:MAG: hypothetical protein A2Z25_01390 [Planctomycetes bacterium RBG_16_55_9]|nr:MAG: hypothetical protein A2Z25_01390 [Planctomycetes bacterium RBG_16_55_9]
MGASRRTFHLSGMPYLPIVQVVVGFALKLRAFLLILDGLYLFLDFRFDSIPGIIACSRRILEDKWKI